MNHGGGHGDPTPPGHGGGHGGMGDMSCPMSMVWNWDTTNLCIVSSSWRITTPTSFYLSLLIIAFIGISYEWLRMYTRLLDVKISSSIDTISGKPSIHHRKRASLVLPTSSSDERRSPIPIATASSSASASSSSSSSSSSFRRSRSKFIPPILLISKRTQTFRSVLYSLSVFISFMLMLVAMTFNAWLIAAIAFGAGLGHYWFNRDFSTSRQDDQGLACHM